ncbi:hypothetical protein PIB30_063287 [Stylosanthes scabra]|uniref:LOB domain-containing protein n=1 Tax=Stylosanthes scabra TaxID=79078 RepID=A0ABU6XMU5_9FABA|nr:hypothetical protein [Stylosanthes scabra]
MAENKDKTCVVCEDNKGVCSKECIYEPLFPAEDNQKRLNYFTIIAHLNALKITELLPNLPTMEDRREAISALLCDNDDDAEEESEDNHDAEEQSASGDNEDLIQEDRKLPPKKRKFNLSKPYQSHAMQSISFGTIQLAIS